jgi:hypothetical protein
MTLGGRCGSCDRELLLVVQLVQPSDGLRCLFAASPSHPHTQPSPRAWPPRVMAAHATLVTALAELASMTGDRMAATSAGSPPRR